MRRDGFANTAVSEEERRGSVIVIIIPKAKINKKCVSIRKLSLPWSYTFTIPVPAVQKEYLNTAAFKKNRCENTMFPQLSNTELHVHTFQKH